MSERSLAKRKKNNNDPAKIFLLHPFWHGHREEKNRSGNPCSLQVDILSSSTF
jgi:hypothetical protein